MSCGCWVSVPPDVRRLDAGGLRAGLGGGLAAGLWGGSHRNGRNGEVAAARCLERASCALSPRSRSEMPDERAFEAVPRSFCAGSGTGNAGADGSPP